MHLPRRKYRVRVRVGHQRDGQFSLLTSVGRKQRVDAQYGIV